MKRQIIKVIKTAGRLRTFSTNIFLIKKKKVAQRSNDLQPYFKSAEQQKCLWVHLELLGGEAETGSVVQMMRSPPCSGESAPEYDVFSNRISDDCVLNYK